MGRARNIGDEILKRISSKDIDKTTRILSCYDEFYRHKGDLRIITHSNSFKNEASETTANK